MLQPPVGSSRAGWISQCSHPGCRKHQQYDCKWYVPLADLVFPSPEESEHCPQVHVIPDHELEDMKMKISAIKSEVQKEVRGEHGMPMKCQDIPILGWDTEVLGTLMKSCLPVLDRLSLCVLSLPAESQQRAEPCH